MPVFAHFRALAVALLVAVLILSINTASGATELLRRVPGSMVFGPRAVWTNGTTTAIFHPLSDAMPTASMTDVRVAFALSELYSNCRIRPAIRFSSDGVNWDTAAPIDSTNLDYVTTEVITYGSQYIDITGIAGTSDKGWVQFGVQAANTGVTNAGFCNATLRVEVKQR